MAWRTGLSGKDRVPAQDDGQTHGVTWGSSIHDPTDHVEGEGAVVVVVEVDVAGSPHTTNGFIVIETPAPSGPVTMATVCQCDLLSGNDERSSTFRSACTPGAETSAPPLRRSSPNGHDVLATSTVPTAGLTADVSADAATIDVSAMVPAGPVSPLGPATP